MSEKKQIAVSQKNLYLVDDVFSLFKLKESHSEHKCRECVAIVSPGRSFKCVLNYLLQYVLNTTSIILLFNIRVIVAGGLL